MKVVVNYTNGCPSIEYDSIQAAVSALLAEYEDGVIYDAGGYKRDDSDADEFYDIRSGRIALAWESENDSLNDDGAHAVASIEVES